MLGKHKEEFRKVIEKYQKIIADDELMMNQQNKVIVGLQEENRQLRKLLDLYEACINKGVKIDFPDVTGKGVNSQSGYKGFNENDIKF